VAAVMELAGQCRHDFPPDSTPRSAFCTRRAIRALADIRYRLLFSLKNTKHQSDGDTRFGFADIPREFSQRRRNATRISRGARLLSLRSLFRRGEF